MHLPNEISLATARQNAAGAPARTKRQTQANESAGSAHFAAVDGVVAECFLDAQELIVFRDPVGATERTGLDLAGIRGHGDVGDRGVFALPERWLMTAV